MQFRILQQPFSMSLAHLQRSKHTQPLALTPTPGRIMTRSDSLRPPSSLSSPWKLVFLTNHSSCPLLFLSPPSLPHPLSPQETEISTRRRECEALEAEVKKKNQTCQTLVSALKIRPRPLSQKDRGWNWFISQSLPRYHHRTQMSPGENEWQPVLMTVLDSLMNKTEKWQRLDANRSAVITTGEQCTQCSEFVFFFAHIVHLPAKKSLICVYVLLALYTGDIFFRLRQVFLNIYMYLYLNAPKCHRVC